MDKEVEAELVRMLALSRKHLAIAFDENTPEDAAKLARDTAWALSATVARETSFFAVGAV